jgi:eukaryotic-like serine/threonine-protein kinase
MTPGYSPPEQYGSSRTNARSDVYSLGATLYAAITGFIPEDSLMRALEGVELTPIRKRNPKISKQVAATIEKSMSIAPDDRYQSAREFKQALLGIQPPSGPPTAKPFPIAKDEPPEPQNLPEEKRARRVSKRPFFMLGVILLLTLAGLFYTNPGMFPFQAISIASPTATVTATATATNNPLPASDFTATATLTATPSPSPTQTATDTQTATPTRTNTPTRTATPTRTNTPQPTPLGGGAGQIAFVTLREGSPQIYTMNPDGSQQERLFLAPGGACQPKWSPDGTKLAYISPCSGRFLEYPNASILIYDLNTATSSALLAEPSGDFDPSWSPDGQSIAFTSLRTRPAISAWAQVYKIDLNSREVTRLTQTDPTQPASQPAWSPDGEQIAYSIRISGLWRIWSMSANGENPAQFFRERGGANDIHPTWAFDNLSVFFTQFRGSMTETLPMLGRYDLEQGTFEFFSITGTLLREASPSPDGLWLAAEGTDGANIDIYLLNTLTRELTRLTTDPRIDFDPDWRP